MRIEERRTIPAPMDAVFAAMIEDESPVITSDVESGPVDAVSDGRSWLRLEIPPTADMPGSTTTLRLSPDGPSTRLTVTTEMRLTMKLRIMMWIARRAGMGSMEDWIGSMLDQLEQAAQEIASGARPARAPLPDLRLEPG